MRRDRSVFVSPCTRTGQQAQHDVGVHQFGRSADILQAGPQLHHRQGPRGGDDRDHLRADVSDLDEQAFLALGGIQTLPVSSAERIRFGSLATTQAVGA